MYKTAGLLSDMSSNFDVRWFKLKLVFLRLHLDEIVAPLWELQINNSQVEADIWKYEEYEEYEEYDEYEQYEGLFIKPPIELQRHQQWR